jgi:hypothetical protein
MVLGAVRRHLQGLTLESPSICTWAVFDQGNCRLAKTPTIDQYQNRQNMYTSPTSDGTVFRECGKTETLCKKTVELFGYAMHQ